MPIDERRLSARSVILSTLLGTQPPRLPVDRLVRACAIFDIAGGTARTAISRMAAAGELVADDRSRYRLAGAFVDRQRAQDTARAGARLDWNGRWRMAVVVGEARERAARADLRRAADRLRLAELRDGVWLRPDNLPRDREPDAAAIIAAQCRWFDVHDPADDAGVVAVLWDLDAWTATAQELRRQMAELQHRLDRADRHALADGFVVSAAALRHFRTDPLLPDELLPRRWAGRRLRSDYDHFDARFRSVLAEWFAG